VAQLRFLSISHTDGKEVTPNLNRPTTIEHEHAALSIHKRLPAAQNLREQILSFSNDQCR